MYNPRIPEIIKVTARKLRNNMTEYEKNFWFEVRYKKLGYKFERQKPVYLYTENSGLDRYIIPDFICIELKLIIEIDGNTHNKKEIYLLDIEKEKLLKKKGFNILRIKNEEIFNDIKNVIERLQSSSLRLKGRDSEMG